MRCGRGRAAALLWRQWRLWRVRVRGGDSVGDGTPGATRVVKKASRRSRRLGQQGKLAGDLGEMDAGAARSGWRGRKGTLTGWGRRVSGSGENGARGLGCEGDWTGAGWAGAGRDTGSCASGASVLADEAGRAACGGRCWQVGPAGRGVDARRSARGERREWGRAEATCSAGWANAEGKDRADRAGKLGRGEGKVGRQVWDGEKGSGPWAGLSAGFSFLFAKTN